VVIASQSGHRLGALSAEQNKALATTPADELLSRRLTQKGEPFKGHDVSLNSLSDLIVKLATTPGLHVRRNLGVAKA
jgi:hypothetical protein